MKEFIVQINGNYATKRRAGTPRIAANEVLKRHPEFGITWNGGRDRQLNKCEILTIVVRNRADCPWLKFSDEE